MQKTRLEVHDYWREPDGVNATDTYVLDGIGRSLFLLESMRRHATPKSKILEIGCNAGRNLAFLWHGGFKRLHGIEISENAVQNLRSKFPELRNIPVYVGPVEEQIGRIADSSFNIVFTMAVLEHIHWDSSFLFKEMRRIAKTVVVIEDEKTKSERHFPRNYQKVFESIGMHQIEFAEHVPGMPKSFRYRVFGRRPPIPRKERPMIDWKPIETAPKSPREVILATNGGVVASVCWSDEYEMWENIDNTSPFDPIAWDKHPVFPDGTKPVAPKEEKLSAGPE